MTHATGTLDIANAAGRFTAEEFHRTTLVTQQMRFATVLPAAAWVHRLEGTG